MKFTQSHTITPSKLTHGWHPGYLLNITEEPKPEAFTLSDHLTIWRWNCAIWQTTNDVQLSEPEEQSGVSSPIFAPAGVKNPASKSYKWVSALLGRPIAKGENPELPEPYPCRIKIERVDGKDFVKIVDFEPWPEAPKELPLTVQMLMGNQTKAVTAPPADDDDLPY